MGVGHHEAAWRHPRTDPRARHRRPALPAARPDRRARQARLGLPRRRPGRCGATSGTTRSAAAGAADPAVRAGRGHRAHRPDRHRLHHLQRALPRGPQVRLAGPHQRRPGRLEHRHLRRARPRRTTSASTTARRTPTATPGPPSSWRSSPSSGTAGRTTRSSATRPAGVYADTDRIHTARPRRARTSGSRGPLNTARAAAGPPAAGPGRIVRGRQGVRRPLRRGGVHRPADPRGRPGRSTPTSSRASAGTAGATTNCSILPGISPIIGSTEARGARSWRQELEELIIPEYGAAPAVEHPRRGPVGPSAGRAAAASCPTEPIDGSKSRFKLVTDLARREQLTVRQLIGRLGGGRGHRVFAGTPEQIADQIEEWFSQRRRRRLQHHAAGAAGRAGGLRRPRRARSCGAAACSAPSTRAAPCARTTAWRVRGSVSTRRCRWLHEHRDRGGKPASPGRARTGWPSRPPRPSPAESETVRPPRSSTWRPWPAAVRPGGVGGVEAALELVAGRACWWWRARPTRAPTPACSRPSSTGCRAARWRRPSRSRCW